MATVWSDLDSAFHEKTEYLSERLVADFTEVDMPRLVDAGLYHFACEAAHFVAMPDHASFEQSLGTELFCRVDPEFLPAGNCTHEGRRAGRGEGH